MGEIVRLNQLPEGSGNLTSDDIFVFMDDPAGSGITKKISLSQISGAIGGGGGSSDTKVIYYSGVFPSTIHNFDHQDADIIVFNLKDNTNIPAISGYLSLTGMKAGKDGQIVKLVNITDYTVPSTGTATNKNIYVFNSVLGSGSLPENRFDSPQFNASYRPIVNTNKGAIIYFGSLMECIYSNSVQKWLITSAPTFIQAVSPGSVGGGGV